MLSDLQLAEFVYEGSTSTEVEYTFKHALTQEVAYNLLLIERRKLLHERIAGKIEALYPENLDDHLAQLAYHYGRSDNLQKAVQYLERAARNALYHSAHNEAIQHLTHGLELLRRLPETPERMQQELLLQTALGEALVVTKGLGARDAREAYDFARKLCERVGATRQIPPVLMGLCNFYIQQHEMKAAADLAEQGLSLAEKYGDLELRVRNHVKLPP